MAIYCKIQLPLRFAANSNWRRRQLGIVVRFAYRPLPPTPLASEGILSIMKHFLGFQLLEVCILRCYLTIELFFVDVVTIVTGSEDGMTVSIAVYETVPVCRKLLFVSVAAKTLGPWLFTR